MTKLPKIIGIIPARYESVRFPGKPLVDIGGKTMVQRVYEQAKKVKEFSDVIIATNHNSILQHAKEIGAKAIMTGEHLNGTSRCLEALNNSESDAEFIINIQGDEPFINPQQIINLIHLLTNDEIQIASIAKEIKDDKTLFDPNCVKVVIDKNNKGLYFSRSPIPYVQSVDKTKWLNQAKFYKHIGLYAYRRDVLEKIVKLKPSQLEINESLEQLRWLENGFPIHISLTKLESIGIDKPEDLEKVKHLI